MQPHTLCIVLLPRAIQLFIRHCYLHDSGNMYASQSSLLVVRLYIFVIQHPVFLPLSSQAVKLKVLFSDSSWGRCIHHAHIGGGVRTEQPLYWWESPLCWGGIRLLVPGHIFKNSRCGLVCENASVHAYVYMCLWNRAWQAGSFNSSTFVLRKNLQFIDFLSHDSKVLNSWNILHKRTADLFPLMQINTWGITIY